MLFSKIKFVAILIGFLCIAYLTTYGAVVALTGAPPAWAAPNAPQATTPAYISYQGTLRDASDNPANGTYNMVVKIYDAPAGGNLLWQETHNNVEVREGHFNLLLGESSPVPDDLFSSPDRYVQLTVNDVPMEPTQRFASVPYASQAANGVPVGTVIDWWRPDASFPVPEGYMICDGSTVTDPQSPLNGKTLPNLTDRFVRGVTDVNQIGTTGGAASHNHSINHDHAAQGFTTSSNGSHKHLWSRQVNNDWWIYDSAGNGYFYDWGDGMDTAGSGTYPLSYAGTHDYYTQSSGAHTHSVMVDLANYTGWSGYASNIPPYIGLLKLCRIK